MNMFYKQPCTMYGTIIYILCKVDLQFIYKLKDILFT